MYIYTDLCNEITKKKNYKVWYKKIKYVKAIYKLMIEAMNKYSN